MNFEECCENGGKVKTKQLKGDRHIQICYDKKGNAHTSRIKNNIEAHPHATQPVTKPTLDSLIELQKYFNNK